MNIFLVDFENVKSSGLNGVGRLDASDQVVIFYSENADSMTFDLHEQINKSKADISFQKVSVGIKNALDFQLATYLGYLICRNEHKEQAARYYVVTKDRGYSSLETYWTQRGFQVVLVGSLASSKIVPSEQEPAEPLLQESAGDPADIQQPEELVVVVPVAEAEAEPVPESADEGAKKKKKKKEEGSKSGKKSGKKKEESPEVRELRIRVEQAIPDKTVVDLVVNYIQKYKTKLGINNALAKEFKDSKKASEIYKSIKPLIADKKGQ